MRNYFVILGCMIFFSCSNRLDILKEMNTPVKVSFSNQEVPIFLKRDSLKINSRNDYQFKTIEIFVSDNEHLIERITFSTDGEGYFKQDNKRIVELNRPKSGHIILQYYPFDYGNMHHLLINTVDNFGAESKLDYELVLFSNLPPKANFTVEPISDTFTKDYKFDASLSRDNDFRFGGRIKKYQWIIEDKVSITSRKEIYHAFSKSGTHTIRLRVLDSDNAWSQQIKKEIEVR